MGRRCPAPPICSARLRSVTTLRTILGIALSLFALSARSAEPFYLGTWKIASATVAPWWSETAAPDAVETKSLVGRTFTIEGRRITGPRQVACSHPHYQLKDYSADMLFQGMFGEIQTRDKGVYPLKVAAGVGFRGTSWRTLETGCETELDFHFLDERTAAFGLNNYIYLLKKQ
jgi:hypothetical protein